VPSYAIVKVIDGSNAGAIAPDAFLVTITKTDGQPLDSETHFADNFACLQKSNAPCADASGR
jgi:hypothetical protein